MCSWFFEEEEGIGVVQESRRMEDVCKGQESAVSSSE